MENPLKHILVFSPYYPPHIGGLESHSDEFNSHLSKHGVSISVFTPRLPINAPEEENLRNGNIHIYRFPACEPIHNYPLPKFWLPRFWKLLFSAFSSKPDILVSRTRFFSTSLLALFCAKIKQIPLVHIEHGSDYATFNSPVKTFLGKLYDRIFGQLVLRFSHVVIANSSASAAFVKKLSGREAHIIYRGVEMESISRIEMATDLTKNKGDRCIIGFMGRLVDGKGVSLLLSALEGIGNSSFMCYIVGDGPDRTRLEKKALSKSLFGKIVFLGHKNHTETIAIMKACDIIANPSFTEGLPTSVIEAALCRKAIVATNVGGTPEIISGNGDGFLIPAGNSEALREKLEFLIDHPDIRAQFGRNAFLAVRNTFNWNTSTQKYLALFKKIPRKKFEE